MQMIKRQGQERLVSAAPASVFLSAEREKMTFPSADRCFS